jgi:hypothetical protein
MNSRTAGRWLARAAVVIALGGVVPGVVAGPVQASARGCTLSDEPHRTCLDVDGSGTRVDDITVDHGHFLWLQNYKAKTWNVKTGGVVTWSRTSPLQTSRAYSIAWYDWKNLNLRFSDPSYQYGSFYHGGGWVDGAPRITIHS